MPFVKGHKIHRLTSIGRGAAPMKLGPNSFEKYGMLWQKTTNPLWIEMQMYQRGGRWKKKNSDAWCGVSLSYHFKEAIKLCWPELLMHSWLELFIDQWLTHRTLVALGPASSGKTLAGAVCHLMDYYCFPHDTTVLICSTTRERLEDRIWGEIKSLHKRAKTRFSWLPGNLIEGRQRMVTDEKGSASEGRDFRNGMIGVPCKKGGDYVGLGDFIGIKNERLRLAGDELHLLPKVFVEAIANLDKNPDVKVTGLGNPKETTDALGVLAEPAADLGGWDGGIDQTPVTKTWATRRPQGICIQFCGADSPNLDGKLGIPLITQEAIDRDIAFYGKDSLQYTMMDLGMMPRGLGSRRVITRQMCHKFGAMNPPLWRGGNLVKIAGLDAAYRGVGGDRCVLSFIQFGEEVPDPDDPNNALVIALLDQQQPDRKRKQILWLEQTLLVPINVVSSNPGAKTELVEDQIAKFCMQECTARGIPPENFFYDSGMRTSLVSSFTRLWSTQTNPIDCGGTASDTRTVSEGIDVLCKDYYSKKITELWYSVRLIIEASQFRGMTEEVMMEGCSREWTTVGNNKIEVEPKAKMKEKTGRSPDLFDSLVIAVEGARQRGFRIGSLAKKNAGRKRGPDWRDLARGQARTAWGIGQLNYQG